MIDHDPRMIDSVVLRLGVVSCFATCGLVVACSSSKTNDTPASTATSTAAAVGGAADAHCAGKPLTKVDPAVCKVVPDAGHGPGDGGATDGGAEPAGDNYGPTNFNSEAEDDDCKYHVRWESTAVMQNADVTFKVTATARTDNSHVANAKPYIEAFFDERTPAPNSPSVTVETAPGTYTIGPMRFNKAGNWNMRFHFNDECTDSETSPHGHVAFFVKVP